MTEFSTKRLSPARDAVAPDGSDVRMLLGVKAGGMAHFELRSGRTLHRRDAPDRGRNMVRAVRQWRDVAQAGAACRGRSD